MLEAWLSSWGHGACNRKALSVGRHPWSGSATQSSYQSTAALPAIRKLSLIPRRFPDNSVSLMSPSQCQSVRPICWLGGLHWWMCIQPAALPQHLTAPPTCRPIAASPTAGPVARCCCQNAQRAVAEAVAAK